MADKPLEEHEKNWPAWYYGPNGEAEVFSAKADVPKGWADHPSKAAKAAEAAKDVKKSAADDL